MSGLLVVCRVDRTLLLVGKLLLSCWLIKRSYIPPAIICLFIIVLSLIFGLLNDHGSVNLCPKLVDLGHLGERPLVALQLFLICHAESLSSGVHTLIHRVIDNHVENLARSSTCCPRPLGGVIATLNHWLVLNSAIPVILYCFLLIRMRNRVEIGLANLRRLPNTAVHICLNGHHIDGLNGLQLLVVHILHPAHLILLLLRPVMLHRTLLSVLVLLIVLIPGYLVGHLQIKLLLIGHLTQIHGVTRVPNYLLVLLILAVMNGRSH